MINLQKMRHSPGVRIYHWLMAVSFLLLLCSGLYISNPRGNAFGSMGSMGNVGKVGDMGRMGRMQRARLLHFLAMGVLTGCVAWRIGHGIVTGNLREILPGREDLSSLPLYLQYVLFLRSREPSYHKYHPLQKLLFTTFFILFILQALSGMTLFASRLTGRLEAAFGGLNRARRFHYLATLLTGTMAAGHIYFALTSGRQKLKSIITGRI